MGIMTIVGTCKQALADEIFRRQVAEQSIELRPNEPGKRQICVEDTGPHIGRLCHTRNDVKPE